MQQKRTQNKKSPQNNSPFGGGFKIYWIYGIIALIFLGLQFTSVNPGEEIDQSEFLNKLSNNEIKSITFVRNTGIAEIEVKDKSKRPPHYYFSYGDLQYLNTKMDEIEANLAQSIPNFSSSETATSINRASSII